MKFTQAKEGASSKSPIIKTPAAVLFILLLLLLGAALPQSTEEEKGSFAEDSPQIECSNVAIANTETGQEPSPVCDEYTADTKPEIWENTDDQKDKPTPVQHEPAAGIQVPSPSKNQSANQTQHQHDWVAVTENQWISDGEKWVVDQAAWNEQVRSGSYIQCSCGATFGSVQEWDNHNISDLLSGGSGHSYSTKPLYTTVEHPEQGHYEERGHYEEIGHYETVTIGYRCSTCQATKPRE